MTRETQRVDPPKEEFKYSEREILEAWNEIGREKNALTFTWIIQRLRENHQKAYEERKF